MCTPARVGMALVLVSILCTSMEQSLAARRVVSTALIRELAIATTQWTRLRITLLETIENVLAVTCRHELRGYVDGEYFVVDVNPNKDHALVRDDLGVSEALRTFALQWRSTRRRH